jgi:secreted protein with Ig-like and vWFA domain
MIAIADGVPLRVETAFGAADASGSIPLFEQAGRQRREDPVEHAEPTPADEAVVDRLVRTLGSRRVAPAQAVADHENDPAHDPPVIDTRNSVRQRKERLDPTHLSLR